LARLRGRGAPLSLTAVSEFPYPQGAPKGVNFKTVRWTVLKEGKPCDRGLPLIMQVLILHILHRFFALLLQVTIELQFFDFIISA
ncbi:MAG: hypothetical protein ACI4JA_04690, partial [Oscillospiraceae bacterium]